MTPLHLIRAALSMSNLAQWSADRGWVRRGGRVTGFDEGRALHHLLDELFGPGSLRPFRLLIAAGGRRANLYAYSENSAADLREAARTYGLPEHLGVVSPDLLEGKEMPAEWTSGKRLGFDLRVRPVRRLKSGLTAGQQTFRKGAELDAFLIEALRRHPDDLDGMAASERSRESVYLDWLQARLGDGARLDREGTRLASFRRVRVSRGSSGPEGPDATFCGTLVVEKPELFHALLMRGVGRHCAYGYGMLLLRPPGRKSTRAHA